MLNRIQVQMLNKGFYTNTDLAAKYNTQAIPVRFMDSTGASYVITPNRAQRRQLAKDKWRAQRERNRIRAMHDRTLFRGKEIFIVLTKENRYAIVVAHDHEAAMAAHDRQEGLRATRIIDYEPDYSLEARWCKNWTEANGLMKYL